MKGVRRILLASVFALGAVQPVILLAAEHGGKEHGGAPVAAKEHGGTAPAAAEEDEVSLLQEAARALRRGQSRPDLAAKLEQLAKEHASHR